MTLLYFKSLYSIKLDGYLSLILKIIWKSAFVAYLKISFWNFFF
jgi:hypothetical protein